MRQGIAVHLGHQDIRDDQGGMLLADLLQRFLAVPGGDDRIAFEAQGDFEQFEYVWDVFDNQDGTEGNIHNASIVAAFIEGDK